MFVRMKNGKIIDLKRYKNETSPISKARGFITLIDKLKICDIEVYEKDITKQADTIEELCDEFVLVNLEYLGQVNPKHYDTLYELKTKNSFEQEGGMSLAIKDGWYAIYGAIWTEKGLIYVAKMNEKGELELI